AIELHAAFIQHSVDRGSSEVALVVFDAFCQTYGITARDIHVVVQAHGLDEAAARRVLKGYFSAWSIVSSGGLPSSLRPAAATPALFAADSLGLMAMFGGQRGTSNYLDEAVWLFDVYRPLLTEFVSRMSAFLHRESQDKRVGFVYSKGLDVLNWITTSGSMPNELYLLSIPVCQPLVALIQLMHVMVLYKTLGVSPGDVVKHFKVAVGHSQGIGIAAAFATLTDEQSFFDVGEGILGIHLLAGAFPQLQFPCYRVLSEPNSGVESRPMVSVQGIAKPVLEQLIAKFNSRQPLPAEHAFLAVANTVDQFIVACEITSVAKVVEFLRSESADADKDQSRIPFPLRKPVFAVQYTTISAPYHCTLLESAAEAAYAMAIEKKWILRSEDMQIAVRASDDGHDIRTESDLTKYLFSAICVLPVDWPLATRYPGITHIVDFGPGGLSGFGFIAYKNIEGLGIPVICAGALVSRSSKPYLGTKADFYKTDLADVTTVPNWLAEFGPKLVRSAHDDQLHIDTPMSRVLGAPT
ncbi:fatty acid synthase alpha subunit Lsd1, partial [Coemansia sp. 'formosensis']